MKARRNSKITTSPAPLVRGEANSNDAGRSSNGVRKGRKRWTRGELLLLTLIVLLTGCVVYLTLGVWLRAGQSGVGTADLAVIFVVTDDKTGNPISNAVIEIESEFVARKGDVLATDDQGAAMRLYPDRTWGDRTRFFRRTLW